MAKPKNTVIRSYDDVDKVLERLLAIDRQIDQASSELDAAVAELRRAAQDDTAKVRAERELLVEAVFVYMRDHVGDFEEKRSRALAWGKVGFRRSESLGFMPGIREEQCIQLCRSHGAEELVRVKTTEAIDKRAAAALEDGALEQIGLRRVLQDTPYLESTAGVRKISETGAAIPVER